MLSRFIRDEETQTRKHLFFGILFLLLSCALGTGIIGYSFGYPFKPDEQTLGVQSGSGAGLGSEGQGSGGEPGSNPGTQPGEGSKSNPEASPQPQEPTSVPPKENPVEEPEPEPTTIPAAPNPTPTPEEISLEEIIKTSPPGEEIIIKNEDNSLIVLNSDETKKAVIEPGEALTSAPETIPPSIGYTSGTEEMIFYDTATGEYVSATPETAAELGYVYSTAGNSRSSSSVNAQNSSTFSRFTSVRDSVERLFLPGNNSQSSTAEQSTILSLDYPEQSEVFEWLSKYKFQIWPLGQTHLVLYRNGVATITRYPVKLSLSGLSFKAVTDDGDRQVLYYPDSVWQRLSELSIVSADTHDEPFVLTAENGNLVYKVTGGSVQRLFAVVPVTVCRHMVVSAETEDIYSIEACSLVDSALDMFSLTL